MSRINGLLFITLHSDLIAYAMQKTALLNNSENATYYEVHSWPNSNCSICHQYSSPDAETAMLVDSDQSRLCERCHNGKKTVLSSGSGRVLNYTVNNHPVKFNPLSFHPSTMNHNIIRKGEKFFVSGDAGDIILFGNTREAALVECSSCHDPHGRSGQPHLQRIQTSQEEFCVICHIHIKIDS